MLRASTAAKKKAPPPSAAKGSNTKGDTTLQSACDVKQAANVIGHAISVLKDIQNTHRDSDSSATKKRKAIGDGAALESCLEAARNKLVQCGKNLCPLPSTAVDYSIKRMKGQRSVFSAPTNDNDSSKVIRDYAAEASYDDVPALAPHTVQPSGVVTWTRNRRSLRSIPTQQLKPLPLPLNGQFYSRLEFLRHWYDLPKGKHKLADGRRGRGRFIADSIKQGYIPLGRSGAFYATKLFEKHLDSGGSLEDYPDFPWNTGSGQQPLLTMDDIQVLSNKVNGQVGRSCDDEIEKFVMERTREKQRQKGIVNLNESTIRPSKPTIQNYRALMSMHQDTTLLENVGNKTPNRYTAETSPRNGANYTAVASAVGYMVVDEISPGFAKQKKTWTESEQFVYDSLRKELGGVEIEPLPANCTVNYDDTVEWKVEGLNRDINSGFRYTIVGRSNQPKRNVSSNFRVEETSYDTGLRIKLTCGMTLGGLFARPFLSFTVTAKELPPEVCPSGILLFKVPGLCMGGGGVTVKPQDYGFLMIHRNDGDGKTEMHKVKAYFDNVLFPLFDDIREEVYGWEPGTPVQKHMRINLWADSDPSQVKAMTSEEYLKKFEELFIQAIKGSASRTGKEQHCDLTVIFWLIHHYQKITTVKDASEFNFHYKKIVKATMNAAKQKGLNLSDSKLRAVIDFLCVLPGILNKVVTPERIERASAEAGLMARANLGWKGYSAAPCHNGLISTIRAQMTKADYEYYRSLFPRTLAEVIKHGQVPESVFDELQVPKDRDHNDEIVEKNQGMTLEYQQRCKILNHKDQCVERDQMVLDAQAKLNSKHEDQLSIYNQLMLDSSKVDLTEQNLSGNLLSQVTDELVWGAIKKCKNDYLKAFVHTRIYTDVKRPKGCAQWPKNGVKGTVAQAKAGVKCMALLAYQVRDKPIILQKPIPKELPKPTYERYDALVRISAVTDAFDNPSYVKGSYMLSNFEWVQLVKDTFQDQKRQVYDMEITQFEYDKADRLKGDLTRRFVRHVSIKVNDDKRDCWCLHFTAKKIGIVAAIMVLFHHVKKDLECIQPNDCLFNPNMIRLVGFKDVVPFKKVDGVYFYYDFNRGTWVRVGMCCMRPMSERGDEHKKGSLLRTAEDMNSTFYKSYPSEEVKDKVKSFRRGIFESLGHMEILTQPLDSDVSKLCEVFQISEEDNRMIEQLNFKMQDGKTPTLQDKQRRAIYYMLEMVYGLCLAPKDNVSTNPGFEQALKQYGR